MAEMQEERSLEETPTWAVAVVCFVILVISIIIEHVIHLIGAVSTITAHLHIIYAWFSKTLVSGIKRYDLYAVIPTQTSSKIFLKVSTLLLFFSYSFQIFCWSDLKMIIHDHFFFFSG